MSQFFGGESVKTGSEEIKAQLKLMLRKWLTDVKSGVVPTHDAVDILSLAVSQQHFSNYGPVAHMQASLLSYQCANGEAERVFNVVGEVKSAKRSRTSDSVTKARTVLTFDAREEARLPHNIDAGTLRSSNTVPDMISVAEWRLAGATRTMAMDNVRLGLKAPWPPEAHVSAAAAGVSSAPSVAALAGGAASAAGAPDDLQTAMDELDSSAEFMNDAIGTRACVHCRGICTL